MKTLVISGGSSGIGKATASLFAERGWRVFELSRHGGEEAKVERFEAKDAGEIIHVFCDVCSEESCHAAIEEVWRQTDHVDVVISNAGRFTQAVLPQLRQQRRGRIIYTSSVAAILAVPYQAFYSASKAAINAFALALANEVREFGISVSVMMPGDVSTGFTDARDKSSAGEEVYSHAHKAIATMEKDERSGMKPVQMAKLFYHIATCRSPRPQYIGGFSYRIFCLLDRILPKRLVNWLEYKVYS